MSEEELPEGWEAVELGALADIASGKFLHRSEYIPDADSHHRFPVAGAAGPIGWTEKSNQDGPTLTIGRVGACGALRSYVGPAWVTDNALVVHPFLDSLRGWIEKQLEVVPWRDLHTGSSQPLITQTLVKGLMVSVPPLGEQRRIVEKVEALLAQVNAARARFAKVPTILKRFRQAILSAACSGRLTEDWRGEKDGGDFAGWKETTLGALAEFATSGSRGWAEFYSETGAIFIRSQDINTDRLVLDDVAHVRPPAGAEGARTRVKVGDLLITITGANVAKCAWVDREIGETYVSQHVALVRPRNPAEAPFLHIVATSPGDGRAFLLEAAYGEGKPGLNLDNVRGVPVHLPPLPEQHEIVRRVDTLFKLADAIEARVAAATARAHKLPQAILAKAFRGELVPTEAELARQEGRDYEPASALLARIRADAHRQRSRAQARPPPARPRR
jgi:type I restriction enzyme S subunit